MEKRILLEKRGRTDDQITELILDNCRSTYIDGLTDNFTALETLSLINVGLVSLKNFPKLINLRKLELSDNRISNSLSHLVGSPKLTHLNLSGNRIKDFDELKPLQNLENLEVLDLFNNQVTLVENYRDKIFQLLPSLKYLDGFDKDFAEAPSDDEEIVEEEDTCEDSDDVSLAYLYNDDLEEDQEDWKSVEGDYNQGDDDSDSDDEEGIENCEVEEASSDGPREDDEETEDNDDDSEEAPTDATETGPGANPAPGDAGDSRKKVDGAINNGFKSKPGSAGSKVKAIHKQRAPDHHGQLGSLNKHFERYRLKFVRIPVTVAKPLNKASGVSAYETDLFAMRVRHFCHCILAELPNPDSKLHIEDSETADNDTTESDKNMPSGATKPFKDNDERSPTSIITSSSPYRGMKSLMALATVFTNTLAGLDELLARAEASLSDAATIKAELEALKRSGEKVIREAEEVLNRRNIEIYHVSGGVFWPRDIGNNARKIGIS
uniref:Putative microtubule binding protein n=1 Tax=Anopheles darlingi TaxID=43151 RepID=A0A2M4CLQ5_ANODA